MAKVLNVDKARALGFSDAQIANYAMQNNIGIKSSTPQPAPQQGFDLTNLLPIIGGIGGSFVSPVLGTAAGAAGGEALRQKLKGENDVGSVLKEGALAGAGGAAGKYILSPLLGKVVGRFAGNGAQAVEEAGASQAGGLSKAGTSIRNSISTPKVKVGPYGAANEEQLQGISRQLGLKGSAAGQYKQLPAIASKLDAQVKEEIANQAVEVPLKNAQTNFLAQVDNSPFDLQDKSFSTEVSALSRRINKLGKGTAPLQATYDLKSSIGQQLSPTFEKIARGGTPTGKEAARLAAWEGLKNTIDEAAPNIRELNTLQHNLNPIAQGLAKARNASTNVPFLGNQKGLTGPRQALTDLVGRGVENVGAATTPVGGLVGKIGVGAGAGYGASMGVGGNEGAAQSQDLLSADTTAITDQPVTPPETSNNGIPSTEKLFQAALMAEMSGDSKAADRILKLATFAKGMESTKKTTENDQFITKALDNIDNVMVKGKLGYGPVEGRLYQGSIAAGGGSGLPKDVIDLNQRYALLKLNILRAYQGARISDADYKLADKYTPSISDTQQTAKTKLEVLRTILSGRKENPLSTSNSSQSTPSLTDFGQ